MSKLDNYITELTRHLKEAIDLMIELDDDKNFNLSDIDRRRFQRIKKKLKY